MFQILLLNTVSASKMEPFVVGGQDASIQDWPFMAFVEVTWFGLFAMACGGSLISSQTALTAAHCLDDITEKKTHVIGISFYIYMGHTSHAKSKMAREVLDYQTHEDYSPEDADVRFDIGIMFLTSPVRFSANVQKVILQPWFNLKEDKFLVVAGWGGMDPEHTPTGASEKLKAINIVAKKYRSCKNKNKVICTSSEIGHPFIGDSGGPVINVYTRRQVGIVSIRDLNSGIIIVTSVSEYWEWLQRTQARMFWRFCGKRK
ncbi:chymotrypsin-like elastase family member 2A [Leguminivora glycinivorella]|uniref:chymotrypsin-like elastase family member 2A n=1 Tax=Leguminivora glycinivorella TaxID=1035111 RepID=UPI00200D48D3|nr:chymotrypsin-like elastase family member 2A [Leguminivora glycinivorella]XP_048005703.1 chymotrypsin-like elastase family member 2A [Leguminivora glycinivorella]